MTAFFITGTDTEIGKTFVTCALLHAARARAQTFDRYCCPSFGDLPE